jgi:death-on-curing protein
VSAPWIPTLDDFVVAATVILDSSEEAIRRLPRLPLAESALGAPFAAFGGHDAYPELADQAAVLIERLARNHPLPDGNKRTALAMAILFLERNGRRWGEPAHDRDVTMVERIASGDADTTEIRTWIDERTLAD